MSGVPASTFLCFLSPEVKWPAALLSWLPTVTDWTLFPLSHLCHALCHRNGASHEYRAHDADSQRNSFIQYYCEIEMNCRDVQPSTDTDKSHLGTREDGLRRPPLHSTLCPCLTHQPDPHLTQGLQPLPFSLICGQAGQLVELQLGGRGSDVQEVGEGLAERTGGQPLVLDPVAA